MLNKYGKLYWMNGRLDRKMYRLLSLYFLFFMGIFYFILFHFNERTPVFFLLLGMVAYLYFFLIVSAKRLHDIGCSALWTWIPIAISGILLDGVINFVLPWIWLILLLRNGDATENKYGKKPLTEKDRIYSLFKKHIKILSKKYKETSYKDEYNNLKTERWNLELSYFVQNVIYANKKLSTRFLNKKIPYFQNIFLEVYDMKNKKLRAAQDKVGEKSL